MYDSLRQGLFLKGQCPTIHLMDVCEILNMKYNSRIFFARECERYERDDSKCTIYFKRPKDVKQNQEKLGRIGENIPCSGKAVKFKIICLVSGKDIRFLLLQKRTEFDPDFWAYFFQAPW